MKFWDEKPDVEYRRRVVYGAGAVIATVVILFGLHTMLPLFAKLAALFIAVLRPLIIGAAFCYLVAPLVNRLQSCLERYMKPRKWTRSLAVLIAIVLILLVLAMFVVILIWAAARQITQIDIESIKQFAAEIESSYGSFSAQVEAFLAEQNISVAKITDLMAKGLQTFLSGAAGTMSTLFFGLIFAIYFLIDGVRILRYWKHAVKAIFSTKTIRIGKQLIKDADLCFSGYIRGQTIDALLVGALTTIALLIAGMPYAIIIGIVTGFGNLIPYVGPILGYGSIALVNLLNFNPKMLLTGLIIVAVIMFVDGNIINPRLLAGSVHVHPLLVVAALLAGGAIGGLLGMLLAVPVGAFVKMQFDKVIARQGASRKAEKNMKKENGNNE